MSLANGWSATSNSSDSSDASLGNGDSGIIIAGYTDGPNHHLNYADVDDWNVVDHTALLHLPRPFALDGQTFERPGVETEDCLGPYTRFTSIGDHCKFYFAYCAGISSMRDQKPYWWTGTLELGPILTRVILALQCLNPLREGANGLSSQANAMSWFDFAAGVEIPYRLTRTHRKLRTELELAYMSGGNDMSMVEIACVAVVRMLIDKAQREPENPATTVISGLEINVQRETAIRVSPVCGNDADMKEMYTLAAALAPSAVSLRSRVIETVADLNLSSALLLRRNLPYAGAVLAAEDAKHIKHGFYIDRCARCVAERFNLFPHGYDR